MLYFVILTQRNTLQLTLWWSFFENLSASVRSGDALSACIFLVSGRIQDVGFIQGLNGISQVGSNVMRQSGAGVGVW